MQCENIDWEFFIVKKKNQSTALKLDIFVKVSFRTNLTRCIFMKSILYGAQKNSCRQNILVLE